MVKTKNMYIINHDFNIIVPKKCFHARLSDCTFVVLLTIYSSTSDINSIIVFYLNNF